MRDKKRLDNVLKIKDMFKLWKFLDTILISSKTYNYID